MTSPTSAGAAPSAAPKTSAQMANAAEGGSTPVPAQAGTWFLNKQAPGSRVDRHLVPALAGTWFLHKQVQRKVLVAGSCTGRPQLKFD